jgi:hypothetical protein
MYKISFYYDRDHIVGVTKGKGIPVGTHAEVVTPLGEVLVGSAWCHEEDNPVKEVGRKIALTRAVESLPFEERRKVWITYFSRGAALPFCEEEKP